MMQEQCRHIAQNILDIHCGLLYHCPACGHLSRVPEPDTVEEIVCDCGEEMEYMSFSDYFADNYGVEYRTYGRDEPINSVRICVAFGGPSIYVDTADHSVTGYWWGDYCEESIDFEASVEITELFQEYWGCFCGSGATAPLLTGDIMATANFKPQVSMPIMGYIFEPNYNLIEDDYSEYLEDGGDLQILIEDLEYDMYRHIRYEFREALDELEARTGGLIFHDINIVPCYYQGIQVDVEAPFWLDEGDFGTRMNFSYESYTDRLCGTWEEKCGAITEWNEPYPPKLRRRVLAAYLRESRAVYDWLTYDLKRRGFQEYMPMCRFSNGEVYYAVI